jgi:hypothetical protein
MIIMLFFPTNATNSVDNLIKHPNCMVEIGGKAYPHEVRHEKPSRGLENSPESHNSCHYRQPQKNNINKRPAGTLQTEENDRPQNIQN